MSAIIIDGKAVAASIEEEIRSSIEGAITVPRLAILTDHSDPACEVYMKNKVRAAARCGIDAEVIVLPDIWTKSYMINFIKRIAANYDGIILQLPIKNKEWVRHIIQCIPPEHDVDGLTTTSIGELHSGAGCIFTPCTPTGIIRLLREYEIPMKGKHAVVIGRSSLVGRPLAEMLLQENATVTVCHSRTENLSTITKQADILISAVGKANLVTADMVKPGAAVIDVGINRVDGKLCGDVDFEAVKEVAGWITPVPGGVGPMTVAMLMQNTMKAVWA